MHFQDAPPRVLPVQHLPLIRALVERLGIPDAIDRHCPTPERAKISHTDCILALILNLLSGRLALYRIADWLHSIDAELLFGQGTDPGDFNDTRLGLALEALDEAGPNRIFGSVVEHFLTQPDRCTDYSLHQDTSSLLLYGEYSQTSTTENDLPIPAHGFSKDHRPDLKQLIFGLTVMGESAIPVAYSVLSGNTSDQEANRDHLDILAMRLPETDTVTIVADCKLADAYTIGKILSQGFHLISLVPETYLLRPQLVEDAWKALPTLEEWPILAERPPERKGEEPTRYRGQSFVRDFHVLLEHGEEKPVEVSKKMRFVVAHSDALAERFEKALPEKQKREKEALQQIEKKLSKQGFACQNDASSAAAQALKKLNWHTVSVTLVEEERRVKRAGRGRPKNEEVPLQEKVWLVKLEIQPDSMKIDAARRRSSCFVLITDWSEEEKNSAWILGEYRHQSLVEGHTGFRWLKGPAAVCPMFLKSPSRIRAMGLVFILALMVRNYLQFELNRKAKLQGEKLPHPFTKQKQERLTTEMAMEFFSKVISVIVEPEGEPSQRFRPRLEPTAERILSLLGVPVSIFFEPRASRTRLQGVLS